MLRVHVLLFFFALLLVAATATLLSVDLETAGQGVGRLAEAQKVEQDTLAGISVVYLP